MKSSFELEQVEKFKKIPQGKGVVLGPGDDAAILAGCRKDERLVFCGDMSIEGVHFDLKQATLEDVGYKAVARTLSDIAAMGARPLYMGFSLAMPRSHRTRIDQIMRGARELLDSTGTSLVGGDLSYAPQIMCDTWGIGVVKRGKYLTRAGARAGDLLYVSGPLGGSYQSRRHLRFVPRIKEAAWLSANIPVNAMMDISDGLALDLYRMMTDSGTGAVLYADTIPFNSGCDIFQALYDGEDYELLLSAPAGHRRRLENHGFTAVGEVTDDNRLMLRMPTGKTRALRVKGFSSLS
jgi:thiamine-monophosphate kinase